MSATRPLHERVQGVVDAYLEAVDAEVPGLVEGLYPTGSTALGEFRPGTSDIDFVAVTPNPPTAAAVAALGRAHTRLRARCPRPFFDGRYVTWDGSRMTLGKRVGDRTLTRAGSTRWHEAIAIRSPGTPWPATAFGAAAPRRPTLPSGPIRRRSPHGR